MPSVLITGANRGIGQELARMLAEERYDVLVGSRDRAKGEAAAARLRKGTGGRLKAVHLDVTDDASIALAAGKLRDGAVKLDAVVHNAGVYRHAPPELVLDTNFFGPLRVTDHLLPLLRDGATITLVTSALGALANLAAPHARMLADPALTRAALVDYVRTARTADAYAFSKAAVNVLTRILAVELAPRGIRVNATDPGWVRTDLGGRSAPRSVEQGAASVRVGISAPTTGGIFRDGRALRADRM